MSMDETWAHEEEEEEQNGFGHRWTFAALVGAFVDLAVAHLLLLAAATTFLASRLLSLFGLRLPSFSSHRRHWCLRSLLSRGPHRLRLRLASLHSSLASRPPFHAACPSCLALRLALEDSHSCGSVKRDGALLIRGGGEDSGDDGSCSSDASEGRLGPRKGLRRRRRRRERTSGESASRKGLVDGMGNSVTPLLGWQDGSGSPQSVCGPSWRGVSGGSRSPVGVPAFQGNGEFFGSNSLHLVEQTTSDDAVVGEHGGSKTIIKENLQDHCRSSEEMIKILEKALEEEQSARAALYLELEKERNASATAADEAMAMIERLQNEKASINMDAKQYQRMIEEKAAYDEEEMELLKAIIVRQEQELFVMGKDVEMYRQIMLSGGVEGQEEDDGHPETVELSEQVPNALKEYEQNLSLTLPPVPQTTEMRAKVKDDYASTSYDPLVLEKKSSSCANDKRLLSRGLTEGFILQGNQALGDARKHTMHPDVNICANDDHLDFQEKGIVSVDVYMSPVTSQNRGVVDNLSLCGVDIDHRHDFPQEMLLAVDTRKSYSSIESGSEHVGALKKNTLDKSIRGIDPYISCTETDPSTFDVHVIDDKIAVRRRDTVNDDVSCVDRDSVISQRSQQGSHLSFDPNGIRNVDILNDNSGRSSNAEELHNERSCSDASRASVLSRLISPLESKRSLMSAVNDERSKRETEVEDLRRRLKIVQQGRQKLNFSVENMEKESFHLQLLDEIALQLREIKQLTQHDKAIRGTSLPPPSAEANTKEKCCRNASHEVHESN